MASATPDLRLPSQPWSITDHWPVSIYTAWWTECVNNFSKVFRKAERPGLEPATYWLYVRCPNHYTTQHRGGDMITLEWTWQLSCDEGPLQCRMVIGTLQSCPWVHFHNPRPNPTHCQISDPFPTQPNPRVNPTHGQLWYTGHWLVECDISYSTLWPGGNYAQFTALCTKRNIKCTDFILSVIQHKCTRLTTIHRWNSYEILSLFTKK